MDDLVGSNSDDERLLRRTFALARFAGRRGNSSQGAILARAGHVLAEGENTTTENGADFSCHAEMNVLRQVSGELGESTMRGLTLYCSAEPCVMCAGAAALNGVGRVVFGASVESLAEGRAGRAQWSCRSLFSALGCEVQVIGPLLEDEALAVLC